MYVQVATIFITCPSINGGSLRTSYTVYSPFKTTCIVYSPFKTTCIAYSPCKNCVLCTVPLKQRI